ncbi:MAG TPA: hypothetical protein VHU23_14225 [Rhizomicrobium sp.]|jgi:hypothetical protein|nr:hypothetical protein [Rhizomicrobium sp.]
MGKAKSFRSSKWCDVLSASPLIVFYIPAPAALGPRFETAIRLRTFWLALLHLVSLAGFTSYPGMIVALIFIHRLPVAKSWGVLPRLCAIPGSIVLMGLSFLPPAPLNTSLIAVSALLYGGAGSPSIMF